MSPNVLDPRLDIGKSRTMGACMVSDIAEPSMSGAEQNINVVVTCDM